jgi:hypothetical protein
VLKETEGAEGDYGQHEQEVGGIIMGDLERVPERGKKARKPELKLGRSTSYKSMR